MNQNDNDRYVWRTGQRWSGDSRSAFKTLPRVDNPWSGDHLRGALRVD
jgi:hypothetical protein